jgi:hypothetical protein
LLGGNNFFLSLVGKKRKKKERKIPLFFSLSLNVRVVVFAPVALSLDEMIIFSSHSERTYEGEKRKRTYREI